MGRLLGGWGEAGRSLGSGGLLSHDVDPVEVAVLVLLGRDHAGSRDGWLGDQVVRHSPVEVTVLEVAHPLVLHTVRDADVHAVGVEHAVDLCEHLGRVGSRAIAAEDGVEGALVDDGIKGVLAELQLPHVHLLVDERGETLLVRLSHLLDHSERDVNVSDVLVAILVHFLGETCRQKGSVTNRSFIQNFLVAGFNQE